MLKWLGILFICSIGSAKAQPLPVEKTIQSAFGAVPGEAEKDTGWLNTVNRIAFQYAERDPDSALLLLNKYLPTFKQIGYLKGEAEALKIYGNLYQNKGNVKLSNEYYQKALEKARISADEMLIASVLNNIGISHMNRGEYAEALDQYGEALKISEKRKNSFVESSTLNNIGTLYFFMGKYAESELHFKRMLQISKEHNLRESEILAYNNLADVKVEQKAISEALDYVQKAYQMASSSLNTKMTEATARTLGRLYASIDSNQLAFKYYSQSFAISGEKGYQLPLTQTMIGLARLYIKQNKPDSALALAQNALNNGAAMGQVVQQRDAHELLSLLYEKQGRAMEALQQYKSYKFFSDSLNNLSSERAAANLEAERELAKRELKFQKVTNTQRWVIFSAIAGLVTLGIIVFLVTRHRNRLNLTNQQLNASNRGMELNKKQLEETVEQLKTAQTQLIHAEKMASLGELTAGIAHELKNPLNFIHNFSEVSMELLEEWKEIDMGEQNEDSKSYKEALITDIASNLDKINQHSKRADGVIQGMLQHSRKAGINKELTDVKNLLQQTLNLSFQGFKSAQKDFDASVEFNASPDIQKIAIIPQDISRVVLNLLNNAFFAVYNKWKNQIGTNYIPKVEVAVYQQKEWVYILVKDNGMGMAEEIKAKVFQPFFTTKPTGQGTGLGLSISYDIVTKGHNGTISVFSEAGTFTEFKIGLPIGSNV